MRVLLTADLHVRSSPPEMCTDEYLPDLFDHISWMAEYCNAGRADLVGLAGDIFDLQNPRANSHKLMQQVMVLLKSFRVPIWGLIGNHDQIGYSYESVFDTQPLGVLYHSGILKLLLGWAHDARWKGLSYGDLNGDVEPLPIYGVPWLPAYGMPDSEEKEQEIDEALEMLADNPFPEDQHILLLTHAPFYPPGQESPYENYPTPKFVQHIRKYTNNPVSVFAGHVHEFHGVYDVDGVTFCNAGALSRGSLTEANIHRPIRLTTWDSSSGSFEIFEIPHQPANVVYKMEKAKERKENKLELSSFAQSVGNTRLEISSTDSIINQAKDKHVEDPVIKVIQNLLEKVES